MASSFQKLGLLQHFRLPISQKVGQSGVQSADDDQSVNPRSWQLLQLVCKLWDYIAATRIDLLEESLWKKKKYQSLKTDRKKDRQTDRR
jgi:hypothetical protein